jgi:hypothetical protein
MIVVGAARQQYAKRRWGIYACKPFQTMPAFRTHWRSCDDLPRRPIARAPRENGHLTTSCPHPASPRNRPGELATFRRKIQSGRPWGRIAGYAENCKVGRKRN